MADKRDCSTWIFELRTILMLMRIMMVRMMMKIIMISMVMY